MIFSVEGEAVGTEGVHSKEFLPDILPPPRKIIESEGAVGFFLCEQVDFYIIVSQRSHFHICRYAAEENRRYCKGNY